jgi:ATP-dependent helicase/nuclease subunit B
MEKITTLNFGENFLERLADVIIADAGPGKELSSTALVFGGRRPGLFLRKILAERFKTAYVGPTIFSMDDFLEHVASPDKPLNTISNLEACFLIYQLALAHYPAVLNGREDFNRFLPWAQEVISFIEQLDLEAIDEQKLRSIEKSAQIGFEIPENINRLLEHIVGLRELYHQELRKRSLYSRGTKYFLAAKTLTDQCDVGFDKVVFCNFFYLHNTEQKIIKTIVDGGKGFCVFQGSRDDWPVLARVAKNLNVFIVSSHTPHPTPHTLSPIPYTLKLYQGFDLHSQVCLVRGILQKIEDKQNTVVVLPRPEAVIPLLSEISFFLKEFNVSMGYPMRRSVLFSLFDYLNRAASSKKNGFYYARDYLNVLKHPLVKNLKIVQSADITRVLIHKLEDLLQGKVESSIGGSLFLSLEEVENEPLVCSGCLDTLENMGVRVGLADCQKVLAGLHDKLFRAWETLSDFDGFSQSLKQLLVSLSQDSPLDRYPFNIKAMEKLFGVSRELESLGFKNEKFPSDQLWSVFMRKLEGEVLAFSGSPLKGLQVLGLMETRSLNFDNVIVMDANEGILPKLKIYEPLIPREVMLSLGLNRLEKEEEIQRYHFLRLMSGAKNVHLIYQENQEKEKSRFIEELLWHEQQKAGQLDCLPVRRVSFAVKLDQRPDRVFKSAAMVDFLKSEDYSASRVNTYLDCPMRFYYKYVLGLDEDRGLLDDPQADSIGTFIHGLLEEVFQRFLGVKPVIDEEFKRYFFKVMERRFDKEIRRRMRSDSFLLWGIIQDRMAKFLAKEDQRRVERIIALEQKISGCIDLSGKKYKFNYTVDRVDQLTDGSIVIVDYKTGVSDVRPKNLDSLVEMEMDRESILDNLKSFQLPIYYYFTSRQFPDKLVNAELYSLRTLERLTFFHDKDAERKQEVMDICLKALGFVLDEIFDPAVPFQKDQRKKFCQHCRFNSMCG